MGNDLAESRAAWVAEAEGRAVSLEEVVVGVTRGASESVRKRLIASVEAVSAAEREVGSARADLRDLAEELETSGAKTSPSIAKRCVAVAAGLRTAFEALASCQKQVEALASDHIASDARGEFDVLWRRSDPAAAALERLLEQALVAFPARMSGTGVMSASVKGISPRVLLGTAAMYEEPQCSVDPRGAANVDHMFSVFECSLADLRERQGRKLGRDEVDSVFVQTFATDIRAKGRSPAELGSWETVPLRSLRGKTVGNTGGAVWAHAMTVDLERHWPKGATKGAIKRALVRAIRVHVKPGEAELDRELKAAKKAGKLESRDVTRAKKVWAEAMLAAPFPTSMFKQDFMAGALLHGIGNISDLFGLAARVGMGAADARLVAECHLGHHMAGFVAYGFSRIDAIPDFDQIAASKGIRSTSARKLDALYREAISLAAAWRPKLDAASRRADAPSLTHKERAEYARDAAGLRRAIGKLPERVAIQLLNDDAGQFTVVGMPKWLLMFAGMPPQPNSNGELIDAVYGRAHQPYKEENEARGSGDLFERNSAIAAERLGLTFVRESVNVAGEILLGGGSVQTRKKAAEKIRATLRCDLADSDAVIEWFSERPASHFRRAEPGEPAYASFEAALKTVLGTEFRASGSASIVSWFLNSAPNPNALIQLVDGQD